MKKYANFFIQNFEKIGCIGGLIATVIMVIFLITLSFKPVNTTELAEHNANLELLKQDFSNILLLDDATIKIEQDGISVEFTGNEYILKAFLIRMVFVLILKS